MNLQTQQTKQNDLGLTTTSQRCFASMSAGQPDRQHQRQMKGKRTMGHNIFLFIYIIAGLAGLITMLIISLAKYSASGNRELLSKIERFVLCTAFIDILYLYIEYRWSISGQPSPSAHPIIRTADILLYIGQMYCWCSYIREKYRLDKDKTFIPPYISAALYIAMPLSAIAVYGFILDNHYLAEPGITRIISVLFEILLCVVMTTALVLHLLKIYSSPVQKVPRIIILAISVFIIINDIWNMTLVIMMISGMFSVSSIASIDISPLMLLIINILSGFLIYYEDFSSLFRIKSPVTASRIDKISESHGLTRDEHEMLCLIYEGLTVSEISVKLKAPQYTIKLRISNIYDKLDVSTRNDIIYLVNRRQ